MKNSTDGMSLCCRNISSVHTKRTFLRWTPAECLDLWQHGYFPSWHLKSILEIMSFSVTCPDWQIEGIVKVNAVIAQVSWALLACHGDFHPDGVSRDTPYPAFSQKGRVTSCPASGAAFVIGALLTHPCTDGQTRLKKRSAHSLMRLLILHAI